MFWMVFARQALVVSYYNSTQAVLEQASTDCRVEPMGEVLHQGAVKTIERLMFFDADTSIATPGG